VILENTRFGTLEVPEDQLIDFPNGIIGFPDAKRFVILEHGENTPIRWLQAVERPELALVIIDPTPLVAEYPMERIRKEADDLGLPDDEECAVAAVVTVPPAPKTPTVNLLAPLLMGVESRKGKQVVLHDSEYHTRHPLVFTPLEESQEPADEEKKAASE
jgi:flagellar assembly factor FliW